jgi:putative aminopeptidase FrvX
VSLEGRLEKYCLSIATSGREEPMIEAIKADLGVFTKDITVDSFGNVMARFQAAKTTDQTVMVFAHTDQLGMIVTKVEPTGFIRVVRLGGVPERVLPGSVVKIRAHNGSLVTGVMGTPPHHLTPEAMKYVVPTIDKAYIDVGATTAQEVADLGIAIGDHVAYEPRFEKLANNRIAGTSVDNRGGCAVLVGLAERLAKNPVAVNVVLVGTVQEEFNLRGAALAAEKIKPVAAISLDLVAAGDTPEMGAPNGVLVGAGPVKAKVSLQRHATVGLLTDASYVQLVNGGTPSIDLCWPTRYTHTGVELCSLDDLAGLETLVTEMLSSFPATWDSAR